MAGDWIKMRCNLWDDPRVSGLADSTKTQEATIIGGLYWLWATADQHTEDGYLTGMSLKAIDRKTAIKGFGVALVEIGWIEEDDKGVQIIRFDEHNGASAKERIQTAKRVANHKVKTHEKLTQTPLPELNENNEKSNGASVTSALPREDIDVNPTSLRDVSPLEPAKQKSITFAQWLAETKAKGEKAVSDYKPVWEYAKTTGIPEDWIQIAWLKFRDRYTTDEKAKKKRYVAWRGVFLRAVKENWLHLWFYSEKTKEFCLTTVGVCSDIETREPA